SQHRADAVFVEKLLAMPVTLEFYFFETEVSEADRIAWGRQAFYDRNVMGVRPNTSLAIGMDNRDAYTNTMNELVRAVPDIKVDYRRRQLTERARATVTASVLRQFIGCFAEGSAGLQKKTVLEVESGMVDELIAWTRTLIHTRGLNRLENRRNYVCASP